MLKQKVDENGQISIIIPTYNESENIIKILHSIGEILPKNIPTQAIVVDDNSPEIGRASCRERVYAPV